MHTDYSRMLEQGFFLNVWTGERIIKVGHARYRGIQSDETFHDFSEDLLLCMPLTHGWFWYEYTEIIAKPGGEWYTSVPFLLGLSYIQCAEMIELEKSARCMQVVDSLFPNEDFALTIIGKSGVRVTFFAKEDEESPAPAHAEDWSTFLEFD